MDKVKNKMLPRTKLPMKDTSTSGFSIYRGNDDMIAPDPSAAGRRRSSLAGNARLMAQQRKRLQSFDFEDFFDEHKKAFFIILGTLFFLGGSGTGGYFLWLYYFNPTAQVPAYFDTLCTADNISPNEALSCKRAQDGITCSFDASTCGVNCPLGRETDNYGCITDCACAMRGILEGDINFNPNNIPSVLSVYSGEDSGFSLFADEDEVAEPSSGTWSRYFIGGTYFMPFQLSKEFTDNEAALAAFNSAIVFIETETCLLFVFRTDETDYISFEMQESCRADIGGSVRGEVKITLAPLCMKPSVLLHSIMHVLGFHHEHTRFDRDEFIKINLSNVQPGMEFNFDKRGRSGTDIASPYDPFSIMHFGGYDFSKNGEPTIIDKYSNAPIKQFPIMTAEDIREVNLVYNCTPPNPIQGKSFSSVLHFWSQWGEWGACHSTCGDGYKYRVRQCLDANYTTSSHKFCPGDYSLREACNLGSCIEGMWSQWSSCSAQCGNGLKTRQSCCEPNVKYESTPCNVLCSQQDPSNIKYTWGLWENWSSCAASCGNAMRRRSRKCLNKYNDQTSNQNCPQSSGSNIEVETCATNPCFSLFFDDSLSTAPTWQQWSNWESCSRTCGSGTQFRYRTCSLDGMSFNTCEGEKREVGACNTFTCPIIARPLWAQWNAWTSCSTTCNKGKRSRERKCYSQELQQSDGCIGGSIGRNTQLQSENCLLFECHGNTTLWSSWKQWGDCSADCNGTQWRERTCIGGEAGSGKCDYGDMYEWKKCNLDCKNETDSSVTWPHWSEWLTWSPCNATCGEGTMVKQRYCHNKELEESICATDKGMLSAWNTQVEKCKSDCQLTADWLEWSKWSECTLTCGQSFSHRERLCSSTKYPCVGESSEYKDCTQAECPVVSEARILSAQWAEWESWSKCTKECQGGTRERERICVYPPHLKGCPLSNGAVGTRQLATQACNERDCINRDEPQGHWGSWSECSATCGVGRRLRKFVCTDKNKDNCKRSTSSDQCVASSCRLLKEGTTRSVMGECGVNMNQYYGDFNGDEYLDKLCFDEYSGDMVIHYGSDDISGTAWQERVEFCDRNGDIYIADFNGDKMDDLLCHYKQTGVYEVLLSNNGVFDSGIEDAKKGINTEGFCSGETMLLYFEDANNDEKADFVCVSETGLKTILQNNFL